MTRVSHHLELVHRNRLLEALGGDLVDHQDLATLSGDASHFLQNRKRLPNVVKGLRSCRQVHGPGAQRQSGPIGQNQAKVGERGVCLLDHCGSQIDTYQLP